jgi:large subunit ribosomal protein L23
MRDATQVIIRPLLTEKSTRAQQQNKYMFEVAPDANKIEIRRAVEELGKCEVEKINTLNVRGKERRTRRGTGRTADWKKAIVTVKEGQELGGILGTAFEGV